ncbi:hypothetical protein HPB52_010627 [Rhipicephalus sanguineus]|uniref:CCHC-type domain-containing protein n=1 Tax=Rhipicephalus sanguineus TaxID=34632 RepID=A0A9D4PY71_RHISA|nr:hypothetical protein HPB52_010627 [Rhipicephalus sanguineus]
MATAMQVTVEGEDIGPAEISESAGWITAFSRKKSTSSRQTIQPCSVPQGANKGAAPASVRKRLTAASRLPRLPTKHFRVIVRPRGGLDIKKTGHFKIAQALIAAAGLTSGEVEEDFICPNMIQNIMVASTPSERNAKAYNTVASIIIDNVTYEVNAYMAAPNNTSKGVIRDIDPTLDQDELTRLIVQSRNPTVIGVRRIKSTSSVIVLFDGLKVPEYVKCGPSLVKCSLYRRQTDICYTCGRLGHRADVCPSPEDGICRGCGTTNPDDQHNCSPKCALCGGNHITVGKDCKRRFQVPYVVRQRRRARRYQKSQEAHDCTRTEPLPPKSTTSRRSRSSESRGNRYRVLAEDSSPSPDRASSKDKGRSVSRGRKGYKPSSYSNGRSRSRSRSRSIGRCSSRSCKLSVSVQEPAAQGTGPTWADRVKGQTKKVTGGTPPENSNARVAQLEKKNAQLKRKMQQLRAEIAELRNATKHNPAQPPAPLQYVEDEAPMEVPDPQLVRTVLLVGRVEILAGAYAGDVGRNFVAQASKRLQRTSEEQQLEPEGEKVELDRLPDP